MLISVVIPTFNEESVVEDCIKSLQKQSVKDLEIIIIDDGSTDSTEEKVKNFGDNIKIFKQNHQGPAVARNLGAKHARGKILVFVDADMTFDSDFIEKLVDPIVKNKVKGTFSKDEFVSNWNNIWAKCWNINENLPSKRRLADNYPDTQKVFRAILKSEFDRVGGYDKGGYTDDYSLSNKLDYEAVAANNAIFYHKNPSSLLEVFNQAKWVAKRKYKLGLIGTLFAIVRSTFPISLILGVWKSIRELNFSFLIFKIVYDFGVFIGIFNMLITGKLSK